MKPLQPRRTRRVIGQFGVGLSIRSDMVAMSHRRPRARIDPTAAGRAVESKGDNTYTLADVEKDRSGHGDPV